MDFNELIKAKKNTVLAYVVFKEHTIGYLFRLGSSLALGILHGSVLRGSPWSILTGNITIPSYEFEHIREATQKDFDDFNVSSKGYVYNEIKRVNPEF